MIAGERIITVSRIYMTVFVPRNISSSLLCRGRMERVLISFRGADRSETNILREETRNNLLEPGTLERLRNCELRPLDNVSINERNV